MIVALANPKWYLAMKEEYEALERKNTWTLIHTKVASKIVSSKSVYKVKYNIDGSISNYKAHLVAKEFHQTHRIDLFETFSLVMKPCTVRVVLSLAIMHNGIIRLLDVNNAFFNGVLIEDVLMH